MKLSELAAQLSTMAQVLGDPEIRLFSSMIGEDFEINTLDDILFRGDDKDRAADVSCPDSIYLEVS